MNFNDLKCTATLTKPSTTQVHFRCRTKGPTQVQSACNIIIFEIQHYFDDIAHKRCECMVLIFNLIFINETCSQQ